MGKKTEFHAVEFVRKVRDEQAAMLAGKSPKEIIALFARTRGYRTRRLIPRGRADQRCIADLGSGWE